MKTRAGDDVKDVLSGDPRRAARHRLSAKTPSYKLCRLIPHPCIAKSITHTITTMTTEARSLENRTRLVAHFDDYK